MNNKLSLPRLIAMITAVVAIISFFLPYISASNDYRNYMATRADEKPFEGTDITVADMMDMSLFEYAKTYYQGGDAIFRSSGSGVFYGVLISSIAGFALLVLLAAWRKRPILTLLCDLLMGGAFYLVNWDFVDRGIMPDSNRVWAIAYHLYYPLVAIIAVCAVWMFVVKRRLKKNNAAHS